MREFVDEVSCSGRTRSSHVLLAVCTDQDARRRRASWGTSADRGGVSGDRTKIAGMTKLPAANVFICLRVLNGTVNYGTFGVMVRLCSDFASTDQVLKRSSTVRNVYSLGWAQMLIKAYKMFGQNPEGAKLPLAW